MLCKLISATLVGVDAALVDVEVDVTGGMPGFHLVGMPAGAVREGTVRIRAALQNAGYQLGPARITVNLAPADLRKQGAGFDLAIALGVLAGRRQRELVRDDWLYVGELSLSGSLKPIRGALAFAESAKTSGLAGIVVPEANAAEARLVEGIEVRGVDTLAQAVGLASGEELPPLPKTTIALTACDHRGPDFSEVAGQPVARRAAEIAAAGGHNLLLVGPPGAGKTMIARRIATVLPSFCRHEALEATRVHSVAGLLAEKDGPLLAQRPFRAPHHSCSVAGLVGGGTLPRPGEVSLAHNGVLFLDELPEFTRASLEALRQPLEDGHVTIVRAKHAVSFPARFMLVASMNPCPCGYAGSELRTCTCGEKEAYRYRSRLSGPLLDRFDVVVRVAAVAADAVLHSSPGEPSSAIARRVEQAREHQRQRYASPDSGKLAFRCNAQLDARGLKQHIALDSATKTLLTDYAELHQLSARAMVRACKVARTIADLGESTEVEVSHLAEALSLLGHHHFN